MLNDEWGRDEPLFLSIRHSIFSIHHSTFRLLGCGQWPRWDRYDQEREPPLSPLSYSSYLSHRSISLPRGILAPPNAASLVSPLYTYIRVASEDSPVTPASMATAGFPTPCQCDTSGDGARHKSFSRIARQSLRSRSGHPWVGDEADSPGIAPRHPRLPVGGASLPRETLAGQALSPVRWPPRTSGHTAAGPLHLGPLARTTRSPPRAPS